MKMRAAPRPGEKTPPKPPAISEAEWKVMRVLWARAPRTAHEVTAALQEAEGWHPNTVKTLLTRLQRKHALSIQRQKNLFLYSPTVTEEACLGAASEGFLERLFGGSVQSLLTHFVRCRKLTRADVEALKRVLRESEPR